MTAARVTSKTFEREERLMARFTVLVVTAFTACLAAPCASALAAETPVKKSCPRASRPQMTQRS